MPAQLVAYSGFSSINYMQEPVSTDLDFGTAAFMPCMGWVNYTGAAAGTLIYRGGSTGPFFSVGTDATGKLTATLFDGTTTRTVTASVATNDGMWHQVLATYAANGTLMLFVDGVQSAQVTGAPLLTLNNAAAPLTTGNNFALTSAWPGSLALVRIGATVPFAEQIAFAYAQEKAMFQPGVNVTLPDTGAVVDLSYDDTLDRVKGTTAANEFSYIGLVRVESAASAAGSIAKVAMRSGMKLLARTGTNPGVDVSFASINLREALLRRAEEAARMPQIGQPINFDAAASQADYVLPVGWEASEVLVAGASKREGSTKDWTRKFDGFKETVSLSAGQSLNTWVQVIPRRAA